MEIRPLGAELLHAVGRTDRQTDRAKLIIALRNFANAPKNSTFCAQGAYVCLQMVSIHVVINAQICR